MTPRRWLDDRDRVLLRWAAALGAALFAAGLWSEPAHAWGALLLWNFFFLSISLAAAVFLSIHSLAGGGWATLFKRVPEAMTAYLPAGGVLMLALLFGLRALYPWAAVEAPHALEGRALLLNLPGFAVRAVLYIAAWVFLSGRLVGISRAQDAMPGDASLVRAGQRASALFLVVFAVTFSLASVEWLMSLEPEWYSTIYPWYLFSGAFVEGLAAITLLLVLLRRRGFYPELGHGHRHDLGKFLFAFSVFWAYLWFSQYLLIWYSNIPQETAHYAARLVGGWKVLFWLNPLVNFVAPFFVLLTVRRKSNERVLAWAGGLILAGHLVDLYLLAMPPLLPAGPRLGLGELGAGLLAASLFLLRFDDAFASAPAVPAGDPYLTESLHHGAHAA